MAIENMLFVPSVPESAWVSELFPGYSPAELPIAGRRVVDYGLECMQKMGISFVEVLDWNYSDRLMSYFSDPTRTGQAVFYIRGEGELPHGLDDLAKVSTPLTPPAADGLFVIWGPCFALDLDKCEAEPMTAADCAETPMGFYRRIGGVWWRLRPQMFMVRDVKNWHQINFDILHAPRDFTLPGYSSEEGVYLGRSVALEHGVEVKAPVLLGDNTWFERNVRLDGDVIVGAGSFVGEGTRLSRTVVGSNTYIGTGLVFDSKIVIGNRVLDPETGVWTDLEDPGLAQRIDGGLGWLSAIWHFLRGRSHGRRG